MARSITNEELKKSLYKHICKESEERARLNKSELVYFGDSDVQEFGMTALFKGKFDRHFTQWQKDYEKGFIIENERVDYAAQCDETTVMVMLKPSDILVISNWRYIQRIIDPQSGNEFKRFMSPLPGTDLRRLPFLLVTGKESLNMISGEKKQMQVLVNASSQPVVG